MTSLSSISKYLVWPIFERFSQYVERLPDGQFLAQDGASITDDGFSFELLDSTGFDRAALDGVLRFRGDVRFAGHHGMLFVMIADPVVDFARGAVTVLDTRRWPDRSARMTLATLGPVAPIAGRVDSLVVNTFLSDEGSALFNSAYPVGTQIDDLVIRLDD